MLPFAMSLFPRVSRICTQSRALNTKPPREFWGSTLEKGWPCIAAKSKLEVILAAGIAANTIASLMHCDQEKWCHVFCSFCNVDAQ